MYVILYRRCDEVFAGTLDECREWLIDHNAYQNSNYTVEWSDR